MLDRRERITDAGRGIARRMQKKHAKWGPGNRSASYYRRSRGTSPAGTRSRERSEANCLTSGCKSRRRRSPCGAVVIPGSPRGDPRIGSPEVKAPGGQVGSEPLRSGQHRGQATRRAAAKANGLIAEIGSPHEADLGGAIGDAKIFFSLIDGQRRCGRMGQCPHRISRRKLKAAILESQAAKARKVWKPDRRILECQRPFL